ncbi:unnamed protein product [Heterobilharzia americana]|nr:unnamed protein product [Heterobilharzia americana]
MNQPTNYRCPTNMHHKVEMDWIGHTVRRPSGDITRQAVESKGETTSWASEATVTWRRSCEEEMKACEQWWSQVGNTVENKVRWRRATEALYSTRNQSDK